MVQMEYVRPLSGYINRWKRNDNKMSEMSVYLIIKKSGRV